MAEPDSGEPKPDPILSVVKPGAQRPSAGRTTVDEPKRRGPIGFLQLLGPGLITGASDDDPSGIGTYSQVGSQFGYGLLWLALFTFPLMSAVQELCARIALQTGVGLGASLRRKFPGWLVGAATLALFAYVITAFFAHPPLLEVVKATVIPHIEFSRDFIMALVVVLGTTISPYLFFWQASSEVDELSAAGATNPQAGRLGLRLSELRAARTDVLIGMAFSNLVMYFIILTSAAVLHAHGKTNVQTAAEAAAALAPLAGPFAFIIFSVRLIGAGLLAIPILTGSATYAIKEFLGLPGSLASKPQEQPTFYLILTLATAAGVVMNFLHLDPIRALFIAAVINGVVAPPLLLLIVSLGADRSVMKRYASGRASLALTGMATVFMAVAAISMLVTIVAGH